MIVIPQWVLEEIQAWLETGQSGDMHLTARAGVVKHIRREELIQAPQEVEGSNKCPACGNSMASHDYGNLLVCGCGVKRTRAQMQAHKKS